MFGQPPRETNEKQHCNRIHQVTSFLHYASTQNFKVIREVQTTNRSSSPTLEYSYNLYVTSKQLNFPKGNIKKHECLINSKKRDHQLQQLVHEQFGTINILRNV